MNVTMDDNATLHAALLELHRDAGFPTVRTVARLSEGAISHAHVNMLLRGAHGSWQKTAALITALGGDAKTYIDLWTAENVKRAASLPGPLPCVSGGVDLTAAINRLADAIERLAERLPS